MVDPTRAAVMIFALGLVATTSPSLTPASSVDEVLDALQARRADLTGFTADVRQTQTNLQTDATTTYRGHVAFQLLGHGDARMHLVLNTKQLGDGPQVNSEKEYLLTGGWLTDRDYPMKNETRRQVVRPGQTVDLFQLGKGPFPLPIGQDRRQVQRQFDVVKVPPAKDDPPHSVHLKLTPRKGSSFERQFQQVDFWIDTDRRLPVRIETVDNNGVTDQTNDLTNVKVNPGLGEPDFAIADLRTLPQGWRTQDIALTQ